MNIALVTYALQVGGVETFLKNLARYFNRVGHTVSIVETLQKGAWSDLFEAEGFRVIKILPHAFRSRTRHAEKIARALRGYDAVIFNDSPMAQAAAGLLGDEQVAISVLHSGLYTMLRNCKGSLENLDGIVTVSPALKDILLQMNGLQENFITIIPNGVDVPDDVPSEKKFRQPGQPLRLVYVGAIKDRQKGVLLLPDILSRAMASGTSFEFSVVGDGPDMAAMQAAFSRKCKGLDITYHGTLTNSKTRQLLLESDVLLMPSYFEGLPLTPLEAMAYGVVPVLSHLRGCTDIIVEANKSGYLIEPGDVDGFARAIFDLFSNHEKHAKMSGNAREKVEREFSSVVMGERYAALIQGLARHHSTGKAMHRNKKLDLSLLGDLPFLPDILERVVRKMCRLAGLWNEQPDEPYVIDVQQQTDRK